jgi:uncharacterized protein YbaP (TraB family)
MTTMARRTTTVRQQGEGRLGARTGRVRRWLLRSGLFGVLAAVALGAGAAGLASSQAVHACPPEPQPYTPEEMRDAVKHAKDRGFLWRITKDGHSSYLYGTIHVGRREWLAPGPQVSAALRATDTVALEMDVMDPNIQSELAQELAALHGAELPADLEAGIRKEAESLCVPYAALAGMAPELKLAVLEVAESRAEGLYAAYAVDAMLAGFGHGAHRRMISLETPAMQMHTMVMKTPEETVVYVKDALKDMGSQDARRLLARLARAWEHSDYAEMDRYPAWCECLRNDIERETMRRMLDDRNPHLAARIAELHEQGGKVFAAVGSLHMFGPRGLPALLEKQGFTVERIALASPKAAH